jgi:methyl-accepting chemotaxis protein
MKVFAKTLRWFGADLGIGSRLVVAFSILIALGLIGTVVGSWRLYTLGMLVEQMVQVDAELLVQTGDWERSIATNSIRTDVIFFAKDAEIIQKTKDAQQAGVDEQNRRNDRIKDLIAGDDQAQALFDRILRQRKDYISYRNVLKVRLDAGEDVSAEVKTLLQPSANDYYTAVHAIAVHARDRLAADRAAVKANAASGQEALLASALVTLLASIGLAWGIKRSLVKPVQAAVGAASAIASGDLTRTIEAPGKDELGQLQRAVGAMQDSLRGIVANVQASSENIAAGTSQIAAGNADLSTRTEEQAASLQQTAASMKQLTESVRGNAVAAAEAAQLAKDASGVAGQGASAMQEVAASMQLIADSSKKISDITSVIDTIAFQTNLLALNAAVEAARAGAQGRGFAVVAGEVRTLARSSADAAKAIKALIGESTSQVDSGSRKVTQAGRTMDDIVGRVGKVSGLIAGISAASIEQTAGIEEVSDAMNQLDNLTQQNASLVEESAAAAESLKQQSELLVDAINVFRLQDSQPAPIDSVAPIAVLPSKTREEATSRAWLKAGASAQPVIDSEWHEI